MHVGHVFSYTHTDCIARYQRMTGREVFYPMGWNDNGVPTERRVENYYGVRCDPTVHYDPAFVPGATPKNRRDFLAVSRRNFIELCVQLTTGGERTGLRSALAPPGPIGRLDPDVHDDRRAQSPCESTGLPRQPGSRRGLPGRCPVDVGHHVPHGGLTGRAGGSPPPRRLPRSDLSPLGRGGRSGGQHAAPSWSSAALPWSQPTPTMTGTNRCSARR